VEDILALHTNIKNVTHNKVYRMYKVMYKIKQLNHIILKNER